MEGSADPSAVGDLIAVGTGPFADLGELVLVGAAGGGTALARAPAAGLVGSGRVGPESLHQPVDVLP